LDKAKLIQTTEELLEEGKAQMLRSGQPDIVFAFGHVHADQIERMPLDSELAGPLMNDGESKDALFGFCRHMTKASGGQIDAWFFRTEIWIGKITEPDLGKRLAEGEPNARKLMDRGFETLVSLGLAKRYEAINVTGQTAEDVVMCRQMFSRGGNGKVVWVTNDDDAELTKVVVPQAHFRGRQKMFGDLREENLS
jgi:hypothetical protein